MNVYSAFEPMYEAGAHTAIYDIFLLLFLLERHKFQYFSRNFFILNSNQIEMYPNIWVDFHSFWIWIIRATGTPRLCLNMCIWMGEKYSKSSTDVYDISAGIQVVIMHIIYNPVSNIQPHRRPILLSCLIKTKGKTFVVYIYIFVRDALIKFSSL